MSTNRVWIKGVLAVGLLVLLSGYGRAIGQVPGTSSDRSAATLHAAPATAMGEADLRRASRVMHARVKSTDGTSLGTVHDLVLTPDLNSISYVALSSGGLFGLGSTLHAIPWSAMTASMNNTYVVPITKAQFRQTGVFAAAHWPSSADTCWTIPGAGTSTPAAYGDQTRVESRTVEERRFSYIKGFPVRDPQGEDVGTIRDMVIAMNDGRIVYTVVSHGGLFGLGTRYTAVPENAIQVEPGRRMARIDVAPTVLQANSFTPNRWPVLSDPAYADQLARAFAVPTGTVLGYVAPGTSATTPPAPPTESAAPSSALTAEPTAGDLTGTFNPANVSTVEGTVVATGKFTPAAGGPAMVWLRIRTEDGRTVLANLGPRSYISAQDFYVVRGDRIRLTGSDVTTVSGSHLWLATEVTYNSHALRLRSAGGTPLWEGHTTSATGPTPPATPPRQPSTARETNSTPQAATTTDTPRESDEPEEP